jgi:C1A family cysteine protease
MAPRESSIMPQVLLRNGDWQRDLPDHRDFAPASNPVRRALGRLRPAAKRDRDAAQVDWREYCPPVADQEPHPTSVAAACIAMVQYFERRASGRVIEPSRAFVDKNARRARGGGSGGVSLRMALKAMVRFGVPPEAHWPSTAANLAVEPPAFTYSFARDFDNVRYCKLDCPDSSGAESLGSLRRFVAAGFVCVLGFPLSNAVRQTAEIPLPTIYDAILGGQAAAVVGYDDERRIRSEKGALLIRASWGRQWGEEGYGWLPYAYVRRGLAVDIWTLLKRDWLRSGEFFTPR